MPGRPSATPQEIQQAINVYALHRDYTRAASALGISVQQLQRRLRIGRDRGVMPQADVPSEDKPRYRVKAVFSDPLPAEVRPEPLYSPEPPVAPVTDDEIRVLAIGDTHDDPYLNKERFKWIGRHAAQMAPDRIVQIGDICDLESLSFHSPNDTDSGRYKPRFIADMESLDRALDELMQPIAQANLDVRFDITLGNHENRIWRFEDGAPEVSGMLQADFAAKLVRYGINFHKYGKFLMIGGVGFTHAPFSVMGRPIGGMTGSQTIARQTLHDVVSGHTHKAQVVTSPKVGDDNRVTVVDLGCALPWGHVQSYAKHTTTGWHWCIWELVIKTGRIQDWNCISMNTLMRRYG